MVFLSKSTPNLPQISDYKRVATIEYTTPLSPRFLCGDSNINGYQLVSKLTEARLAELHRENEAFSNDYIRCIPEECYPFA